MKRWLFVLSASATLITATPVLSRADDDSDSDSNNNSSLTSEITGITREFTFDLNVVEDYEIRPGVPATDGPNFLAPALVDLWAFSCQSASGDGAFVPYCAPGAEPTLPGPLIRGTKGDLMRLTFKNTHEKPHTIHLHGFHRNNIDGVHPVPPHENFLIEWVANPCGTYVYHCHINTPLHQDRGMYGQFVVDCPDSDMDPLVVPEPTVDHEFLAVVDEQPRDWPSLGDDPFPKTHEYIINGKAFVPTSVDANNNLRTILSDGTVEPGPMVVHTGDTVRIRLSSFGMANHEMELEGHDLEVRQGSNPTTERPASIAEPPPEVVTNHSLNLTFTAGAPGSYRFRSTNPVERRNYERLPGGSLRMGEPDEGGMQTILVVESTPHPMP